MNAPYSLSEIEAALDRLPALIPGIASRLCKAPPISSQSGSPTTALDGPPPATAANVKSDSVRAACAGLVNIEEIRAAAPFIPAQRNYAEWRDSWLFPMATAIRLAPEHRGALESIFDQHNRRTADAAKVAAHGEEYFTRNWNLLNAATKGQPDKVISPTRILETACDNGWNGRTDAQAAAPAFTTVVNGGLEQAPFFVPVKLDAANLYPVPWLVFGLLLRGEITVLTAQGGGAKTALAILIAVTLAAGRQNVGPFRVSAGAPALRVAVLSAEEDTNRIGLLVAAAASALGLTAPQRAALARNLLVHDARESGWCLGQAQPNSREAIASEETDRGLAVLREAMKRHKPDLIILDTLAALFATPSELDNQTLTALMRRLSRAAKEAECAVLLLHHAPKMTRETAAAQRGEPTLARGGSAIVNSARVVLTITSLPTAEAGQAALIGHAPESVRRLEHAKINDAQPMDPAYFAVASELIQVNDGTSHAVRALRFINLAASGTGWLTDAVRSIAMKAIDAGVQDEHGARVPLSPGGGKENRRDAVPAIARALMGATPELSAQHARAAAREVLKDLQGRIGCVVEQDVMLPQYKADGKPNGTRTRRGLVTRWDLAPWTQGPSAQAKAEAGRSEHYDGRKTGAASAAGSGHVVTSGATHE